MGRKHRTEPTSHQSSRPNSNTSDISAGGENHNGQDFSDSQHDVKYGNPIAYDPNFKGPVKRRSCTDVICLLLFLAFLGGWGFVAYVGISHGDINKIIFPTDTYGRICGQGVLADRPYLLFFDLTRCLNPAVLAYGCLTPQVCVTSCPEEAFSGWAAKQQDAYAKEMMKPFCYQLSEDDWKVKTAQQLIEEEVCPAWVLPSQPILGRCLPLGEQGADNEGDVVSADSTLQNQTVSGPTIKKAVTALGAFLSVREWGERIGNDLVDTWWMICISLIGAACISFIWIILMRFMAGFMVWTSILLFFSIISGLFGYCLYRYLKIKDAMEAQGSIFTVNFTPEYWKDVIALADTWLAFSIILGIVALIILLILIALRQRINIAIQLIEQASKAVNQLCSTLLFPVLPFLLHCVVVLLFTLVALFLSTASEGEYNISYNVKDDNTGVDYARLRTLVTPPEPPIGCGDGNCINPHTGSIYLLSDTCVPESFNESRCNLCSQEVKCQFTKYTNHQYAGWMQWFNLFGLYWGLNFVSAFSEIVLAGAFASWYWTWDKSKIPFSSLWRAYANASFYHLGTVAFGSLILAIIRFIRAILNYVESKLKMYNNDLVRCLLCLCKCCLWCLEKFMRFLNRNAYIMCAIKSTNFCVSAKQAFNLLMRNIVRVVVLNKVVDFLLLIGKLVIVSSIGTLSYFFFSGKIKGLEDDIPTLNYFFTPVVVIVIGSYFISCSFFGVYGMAVDTLFLCFLEDLERNDGTPAKPYFMSRGLQKVVGKMQKFKVEQDKYRPESASK